MPSTREDIIASIQTAKDELESVLDRLEEEPPIDAEKVRFAVHALGNYMTVMAACIELLASLCMDEPDEQISRLLHGLRHATHLMRYTVRQLTGTVWTEDVELDCVRVDMPLLVERVCHYYHGKAEGKGIEIDFASDSDIPTVWTDCIAVAAVLDNLLSNAVKYSEPGSRITVRVASEPGHVVCSVRDAGPGLSEEDQGKLFQKGMRLGQSPTGGERSRGYGLAVAKDLMDRLGGTIWCESELGQSACFSFRLPVGSAPA